MARLSDNSYGKSQVRLTKVVRAGATHTLYELSVQIMLVGAFEEVYTKGDNSACIPTDTMKNTVYALAESHPFTSPEELGRILASHFIDSFRHVTSAEVTVEQTPWTRVSAGGRPHDHSFVLEDSATRTAIVRRDRGQGALVRGGLQGLEVIKTTRSSFAGFLKDEYTTLAETTDRIFATAIDAVWDFAADEADYNRVFAQSRRLIPEAFAQHDSRSVQHTIFAMGEALLREVPEISRVSFTLPNRHRLPVAKRSGIFVATTEPFGLIKGTVTR
jgi:urate oxidase